jgi:hypothetical protein
MDSNQPLSAGDFPAKISVMPAKARASKASGRGSGESFIGSFAKFDRLTQSWKTWPHSGRAARTSFSATWPKSGTMRSGIVSRLVPLVRLIGGIGSGLWPTPVVKAGGRKLNSEGRSISHTTGREFSPSLEQIAQHRGGLLSPKFVEWLMGFPIGWTDCGASETR